MTEKAFSAIAAVIFALVALLHLLRLVMGWSIVIDSWTVPMWVSWVGLGNRTHAPEQTAYLFDELCGTDEVIH